MDYTQKLDLFVDASALVTGFERIALLATGMAYTYLETVEKNVGESITDELYVTLDSHLRLPEKERESTLRIKLLSNPKCGPVLRAIIKLWYLGQWEPLSDAWVAKYNGPEQKGGIVSPEAYKEGLVWVAIDAHPMGAKQPGFGTWSSAPKEMQS